MAASPDRPAGVYSPGHAAFPAATSLSLLDRARSADDAAAWGRLVGLYRPLVQAWAMRAGAQHQDAEDLAQGVMAVLVAELPAFQHAGRTGSFRCWLRAITANRLRAFWRAGRVRPAVAGDAFLELLAEVGDPAGAAGEQWDRGRDAHVLAGLLDLLAAEFTPPTLLAFGRVALDGLPAEDAAAELGLTVAAVYIAKSRVLRRLKEEAAELLAD